ncbi:MAG: DUF2974 domain-containing protein [Velocimicrobium sp.]
MGNCIDYLIQNGKYGLFEKPFNDVDSLILCQLSYLKFEGIVPELSKRRKSMKFMDVFTHPLREKLFIDQRFEIPNRRLFEAAAFSKRFQTMKINYIDNQIDLDKQIQFAAMTFFLEDGTVYVAFRGTDETIIGWKEDFNMAFKTPIPSQLLAVEYLSKVARRFKGNFIVGGHSKGGNLAVYASMKCQDSVRCRILYIYTNDGPGFMKEVFSTKEFESIQPRIIKIVPQSSLIGMLLQHQEDYQVIESKAKGGVGQHDPYTWEVKNDEFVYKNDLNQGRKLFNERLNGWVEELNEEERSTFVETLYKIISVTEAETLMDLTQEWKDNSLKMVNAIKEVDADSRKMLRKIIGELFHITKGKKTVTIEKKKG